MRTDATAKWLFNLRVLKRTITAHLTDFTIFSCLYDPSTLPRNHCGCEQGFVPIDEGYRTCQDVNECDIDNGGCSDECFNYPGGELNI